MSFFGSIGLGAFGATRKRAASAHSAVAAQRKATAAANAAAKKAAADAKQLAAAQGRKQTAAIQAKEAGLQAAITAFQSGATVKQAATAQKQATAAAKTAIKAAGATGGGLMTTPGMTPGTDQGIVPGAGMDPNNLVIGPPSTLAPSAISNGFGIPTQGMPGMSPMPGGYGGGGPIPGPGGYSIGPAAGGYTVGGPEAPPTAYAPVQQFDAGYTIGPAGPAYAPSLVNVPQTPYGTSLTPTPYSGAFQVLPSNGAFGLGVNSGGGNIATYATAMPGDSKQCANKRKALSKAYTNALKRMQKNPNAKAMDQFQKRYPKLIAAIQGKCTTSIYPNAIPGVQCGPSSRLQRNIFGQWSCVPFAGGILPPPGGGFLPPPASYPQGGGYFPGGGGAQPGETVWSDQINTPDGQYEIGVEGAPGEEGGLIPAGGGGMITDGSEDNVSYSSAVMGPVSGRDSDNIPVQGDDGVTDAIDPSVLAMSETGGSTSNQQDGTPDDFEDDQNTDTIGVSHKHDMTFNGLGFIGRARGNRRKPMYRRKQRALAGGSGRGF